MWCADMRVLYCLDGELYVGLFEEVNYEEYTSLLILSGSTDLQFKMSRTSALLALSKLLTDGYCDLQSFDCGYF